MIGFGWAGERRHDKEYLFGQRQMMLIRAALAGLLILVLLAVIWPNREIDGSDRVDDEIVSAPFSERVAVTPPIEPEDDTLPEPMPETPLAGQKTEETAVIDAIDIEPATIVKVDPSQGMPRGGDISSAPRSAVAGTGSRPPSGERSAASPPAPANRIDAPEKRYRVVVGDFLEPAAASKLCDQLMDEGYGLTMQHRVTAGPYATHAEAEKMVSKLHREQQTRGMIVNAAGTGFLVQLGVFSEPANAQGLLERLTKAGYPIQAHMRIMAGPFSDRQKAETAAAKLQQRGTVKTMVVTAP